MREKIKKKRKQKKEGKKRGKKGGEPRTIESDSSALPVKGETLGRLLDALPWKPPLFDLRTLGFIGAWLKKVV